MGHWQIGFEHPSYLVLLLILPFVWWVGYHSLSGLGSVRKYLAIFFRTAVLLLIIFAIAGVQWIWISDRLTVIFVLDQSDSIPQAKRQAMLQFAIENVKRHRNQSRQDRAGLIVFGREAAIEFPPMDEDLPPIKQVESYRGTTDATDLESALKLAQACFPEDSARRIVIVTDGNETLGNALPVASSLVENGIGIDVVPIRLESNAEILVEKIDVPSSVRQGQPFDTRVVIHRYVEAGEQQQPVDGMLTVRRRVGNQSVTLAEESISLDREVNVISIPDRIDLPAGYTYEAEFVPFDKNNDAISQNNRASSFAYVRGKGRVLMIEDSEKAGEYDSLVDALRRSDIEVEVRDNSQLFTNIVELQAYDSILLAGVPRSSGAGDTTVVSFTDEHIEMMATSANKFGVGIVMIGGPEAFGAGGWANTKLEEAMPVDFQIRNSKIEAVGALAMVMHASEIPDGNYWQKVIARSALDTLGPMDFCGVIQYDALGYKWLWGDSVGMSRVGPNRSQMRSRLMAMQPMDMPDFDPTLNMALNSLVSLPASIKHVILISDGDPSPSSNGVLTGFVNAKIRVSTVAVGAHGPAGHQELLRIANTTGGNYYVANSAKALPKIFQREARRVSKPLVYEPEGGDLPQILSRHEIIQGIDSLPAITGFVLTDVKKSSLVEVPLRMPRPSEPENATLLAAWTYGLGRTAVFTSDAGKRWNTQLLGSPLYDKFFSQLVRWSMRPTADDGKYQIATQVRDGKVQVIVTALDQDDRFLNFLNMSGIAVAPNLQSQPLTMQQVAPGRYVGEFEATASGSYMVSVVPAPGQAPLTVGASVPFSDEYRVREANIELLRNLANLSSREVQPGTLLDPFEPAIIDSLLGHDTYRGGLPRSKSLKDVWPWAVLVGAILFFGDVFVRRVSIDFLWFGRWMMKRFRPDPKAEDEQRLRRLKQLRGQKEAASQTMEKRTASAQFQPDEPSGSEAPSSTELFGADGPTRKVAEKPKSDRPSLQEDADKSYTSRLLEAKRKAKKKPS